MQGVELALSALEREASGALQHVLRARAEEAAEVDRPLRTRALARHVPGEELVERAAVVVGAGRRGEVFGHSISKET